MPFSLDAEVAAVFAAAAEAGGPVPVTPRGDAIAMRNVFNARVQLADAAEPDSPSVRTVDHTLPVADGEILVRGYTKDGSAPGASSLAAAPDPDGRKAPGRGADRGTE